MFKRVLPLMMVSYVAWQWTSWLRQRSHERVYVKHRDETRWEGEGGALPVTGSQLAPDPQTAR